VALHLALRADAPVRDVGFVDLVAAVVGRGKTRRGADGAVDVDEPAAGATDEVVMVVIDAILVAGGRADRLNSSDETLFGEESESVVDGLSRDRTNFNARHPRDVVGRDVGLLGDRS